MEEIEHNSLTEFQKEEKGGKDILELVNSYGGELERELERNVQATQRTTKAFPQILMRGFV